MKCHCILTTLCIVEDIVLCRACSVCYSVTVPGKALTGDNRGISVYTVIDSKMKCHCILTTLCIVEDIVLCRACSVCYSITVPGKALTGDNRGICVYTVVDRKMKCHCILTTLRIVEDIVLCRACSVCYSITVPGKALTGDNRGICVYTVVDSKMQCYCILTTLCIVEDIVLCRACSVCYSITVPGKALTGDNRGICVYTVVDSKMKCYCILTTLCIVEDIVLCRACSVCYSVTVPGKALTGDNRGICVYTVVDRYRCLTGTSIPAGIFDCPCNNRCSYIIITAGIIGSSTSCGCYSYHVTNNYSATIIRCL